MALILAIETATKLCSVALGKDGVVLSIREDHGERLSHAELVNLFAQQVLEEAGYALQDVEAFAVGIGPGSYTGLRIGVSAAKGWCFALDRPLIGISTLRTLVEGARKEAEPATVLWPMVDARRMEVFTQPHDRSGEVLAPTGPAILDRGWIEVAGDRPMVFGDGADKAADLWKEHPHVSHLKNIKPSAAFMIPIAESRSRVKEFDDLAYLVPEYGKAANVTQAKPR